MPAYDPVTLRREVPLERYAEVLAHVMHFRGEDLFEVVRRLGVDPSSWYALDAAWTGELGQGIKRRQRDQALRFSATLMKTRERLARVQPPFASIGADAQPAAAENRPAAPLPSASPIATPSRPALPSPGASPWAAWSTPRIDSPVVAPELDGTGVAIAAVAAALPFDDRAAAAPESGGLDADERALAGETAFVDVVALGIEDALPFEIKEAPALTVEQLAAIAIELDLAPDNQAAVLAHYGLSDARWRAACGEIEVRARNDAGARTKWDEATAAYRAWRVKA